MEGKLGYKIDPLNYPHEVVERFYSDLRPVSNSVYERTKTEFEEYERQGSLKEHKTVPGQDHLKCGACQTIVNGQHRVQFKQRTHVGLYTVTVDIHYGFGLELGLLFTKKEAFSAMAIAKLQPDTNHHLGPFFKLPKELREKIYTLALPKGEWTISDDDGSELNFARGVGDLSGFYFPLSNLTVLKLNRQIRQEALPLAYRRTVFHFDDMDDLVSLLIAVGDIGRNNIESIELAWRSRSDSERQWSEAPTPSEHLLTLPTLHVGKCVQLLKQCKRLRFLRLYFERDHILDMSPDAFKADPGLSELCSIQGIKRVEIWDLGDEPIEHCDFTRWLKGLMEAHSKGCRK
ncbi:hypothetical protein G7Y89_g4145 [Cudoniella acicularis]|uniref:Uncharacterized protein n=1 Tax=Cudoniella acicularis TaxID=354080 RepID=A0A8H4RS62_9HELO|nr:hypothetical protein G7Y89_g4145 [Cudoniella acicularis]